MIDFQWKEKFKLGVEALDEPHRRMLALAEQVAKCLGANAAKEEIAASVRALSDFNATHSAEEERLMAASGYQENIVHAEHHQELAGQFERFAQRVLSHNSRADSAKMLAFLRDWMAHHIMITDRQFAAYLSSKGDEIQPPG